MNSHHHNHKAAFTVGSQPPIIGILWSQPEPGQSWDAGFMLLYDDAPEHGSELAEDDERVRLICLDCLLDEQPGIGRGLDLARRHGTADLTDDGEWIAGDDDE